MKLNEILAELSDLGVKLWVDGEQLRIRVSRGRLRPELRNALAKNKAGILSLLRQRGMSAGAPSIPLVPVPRNERLLLSFAQEGLWFLDQLEGASAAYNIVVGLKLKGVLEVGTLEQSLAAVVGRHEVLRTTFPTVEGVAVQMIAAEPEVSLPAVDLQGLS